METELRTQLKRQAAAHSDHLADMLHLQESQLESKSVNFKHFKFVDQICIFSFSYLFNIFHKFIFKVGNEIAE